MTRHSDLNTADGAAAKFADLPVPQGRLARRVSEFVPCARATAPGYLARCKPCNAVTHAPTAHALGNETVLFCARCGAMRYAYPVIVTGVTDTACGAKCRGARGPACDCSCGGVNHGSGPI